MHLCPIEKVVSDLFRIPKMFGAFVSLSHKSTKAKWAPSSEFVSSSIPSWPILTAHAQPFRGARDLAFCLKVPLDSLLVWASSGGSGETARMRRLAWTFAARIGDKYQIRLARPKWKLWLSHCCHDNRQKKCLPIEARFLLFETWKIVPFEDYKSDSTSKCKWISPFDKIKSWLGF